MANDIIWYDSSETGAPVLNNVAGSLDAVLHACLVTGFRTITLDSVTVTSGVAVCTYAGGHGYSTRRVVELAGAVTGAINGRKLITTTGAGTFTFPAPGVADGTISGTITCKRAPLGWTRPHSAGNVSIYARSDVTATGMLLRVDDSNSTPVGSTVMARCLMVEAATGVSAYTGAAPTPAQSSFGVYWYKGGNTTAAGPWILVGDGKRFYLFSEGASSPFASYGALFPHGFGDLKPYRSGDAHHAFIAGSEQSDEASFAFRCGVPGSAPQANKGFYLSRAATQIGAAVAARSVALGGDNTVLGSTGPLYPSYVDNGFAATGPVFVAEANAVFGHPLRGELPGLAYTLSAGVGRTLHGMLMPDLVGTDKDHLVVGLNTSSSSSSGGLLVDVTGPW